MTVEELKTEISELKTRLDFLSKQLSDLETKGKIKNFFNSLKNTLIWIFPLVIFLVFMALLYFFLDMSWKEFVELLKLFIWPVTILIILFFFRKIFTYLFFSIEEFNFFGAKGRLKNIQDIINERARKLRDREKTEEQQKKKLKFFEEEITNKQNLIQKLTEQKKVEIKQWSDLAKDLLQRYKDLSKDYSELNRKYMEKLKQEEESRIKREAIRRVLEERRKGKQDLPF